MIQPHHIQAYRAMVARKESDEAGAKARRRRVAGGAAADSAAPAVVAPPSTQARPAHPDTSITPQVPAIAPHRPSPRTKRMSGGEHGGVPLAPQASPASGVAKRPTPRVNSLRPRSGSRVFSEGSAGSFRSTGSRRSSEPSPGTRRDPRGSPPPGMTAIHSPSLPPERAAVLKKILLKSPTQRSEEEVRTLYDFAGGMLRSMIPSRTSPEVLLEACRLLRCLRVGTERGLLYGEGERSRACYIVLEGRVELYRQGMPLVGDGATPVERHHPGRSPSPIRQWGSPTSTRLGPGVPSSRPGSPSGRRMSTGPGVDLSLLSMQKWEERVKSGFLERTCVPGDVFGLESLEMVPERSRRRHTAVAVSSGVQPADAGSPTKARNSGKDNHGVRRATTTARRAHHGRGRPGNRNESRPGDDDKRRDGVVYLIRLDSNELRRLTDRVGADFQNKLDLLRQMHLFSTWPPAVMFRFVLGVGIRRVPRHAFLFRRGTPAKEIFVVKSGALIETMSLEYRPEHSASMTAAKSHAAFQRHRLGSQNRSQLRATTVSGVVQTDVGRPHRRFNAVAGLDDDSVPVARIAKLFQRKDGEEVDTTAVAPGSELSVSKNHRTRLRQVEVGLVSVCDTAGERPLLDDSNYHTTDVRADTDSTVVVIPRHLLRSVMHGREHYARVSLRFMKRVVEVRERIRQQCMAMALFHPDCNVQVTKEIMSMRGLACSRCGVTGHSAVDSVCPTLTTTNRPALPEVAPVVEVAAPTANSSKDTDGTVRGASPMRRAAERCEPSPLRGATASPPPRTMRVDGESPLHESSSFFLPSHPSGSPHSPPKLSGSPVAQSDGPANECRPDGERPSPRPVRTSSNNELAALEALLRPHPKPARPVVKRGPGGRTPSKGLRRRTLSGSDAGEGDDHMIRGFAGGVPVAVDYSHTVKFKALRHATERVGSGRISTPRRPRRFFKSPTPHDTPYFSPGQRGTLHLTHSRRAVELPSLTPHTTPAASGALQRLDAAINAAEDSSSDDEGSDWSTDDDSEGDAVADAGGSFTMRAATGRVVSPSSRVQSPARTPRRRSPVSSRKSTAQSQRLRDAWDQGLFMPNRSRPCTAVPTPPAHVPSPRGNRPVTAGATRSAASPHHRLNVDVYHMGAPAE